MLRYKKTRLSDIAEVERMNEGKYAFTPGELTIVDGLIYDDETNKNIAFGIVKPFAEAVFITDKEANKVSRGKALNILMNVAITGTHRAGMKQLHVFVSDPKLAEALKNHHGFELCPEFVLVKNLI